MDLLLGLCQCDDPTAKARSCVACLQGLLVASLAEVVFLLVDHAGTANDVVVGAIEHAEAILNFHPANAIFASHNVAQVASVAHLVVRAGMVAPCWVEVWACSRAAVGQIALRIQRAPYRTSARGTRACLA